jgi:hypothetical protein
MKGIIFTELLTFVALSFNEDMVDDIIDDAELPSGGAYTAVGSYDHSEIVSLVIALHKRTNISVSGLIEAFGSYLGKQFSKKFESFFQASASFLDFLESVEVYIHIEVRKLYPDAELPSLITIDKSDKHITLRYQSPREMEDVAVGLIYGCSDYYQVSPIVTKAPGEDDTGKYVDLIVNVESTE